MGAEYSLGDAHSLLAPSESVNAAASVRLFTDGVLDAIKTPLQGLEQLGGIKQAQSNGAGDKHGCAYTGGQILGNAATFLACTTVLKRFHLSNSASAVGSGALLGFAAPVVHDGSIKERLEGMSRGAASMLILDRLPGMMSGKVFRSDIIGNTLGVVTAGAAAGAVDANLHSFMQNGKAADLKDTLSASFGWAAMGSAFHLGSMALNKGFRQTPESKSQELLVIGGQRSEACFKTRDFLNSVKPAGINYRLIDTDNALLRPLVDPNKSHVVFPDGSIVDGSNIKSISDKLQLHRQPDFDSYRVVVVGAGPAGVQSAVTLASELPAAEKVAVVADRLGGQTGYTSSIKNYMGFPDVSGADLMKSSIAGAKDRGAEFVIGRVQNIEQENGQHVLTLLDGSQIKADAVVLATGMKYNQLTAPGIDRLSGKGVYTLADASESKLASGKHIAIVGAGNSAGQAAVNFSANAETVDLLVRGKDLKATMSEYLIKEVVARPNIKIHWQTEVSSVNGENHLETVSVKTAGESGETRTELPIDAMYVYIGGKPNTQFLAGMGIELDQRGFILTGSQLDAVKTAPGLESSNSVASANSDHSLPTLQFETSVKGIFAAGDANAANPEKRVASAVADGGRLGTFVYKYLENIKPTPSLENVAKLPTTGASTTSFAIPLPLLTAPAMSGYDKSK